MILNKSGSYAERIEFMKSRIAPVVATSLALLLGVGAFVVQAKDGRVVQKEPSLIGAIGSADIERIYIDSGAGDALLQAAQARQQDSLERLRLISSSPYLESAELGEFGVLMGKLKPTPDEQKRLEDLKALSIRRGNDLKTIQTKLTPLSDEEKKSMSHLIELKNSLEKELPRVSASFQTQQEEWAALYRRYQLKDLRNEVGKVAKEKGIAHVFDTNALIFTSNDVTQAVLDRLKKQPLKPPVKE